MRYFGRLNRLNALVIIAVSIMIAQSICEAQTCPCDIYAAAGTPCVGAYSTTRKLLSTYTGSLYQVRRTSDNTTKDIGATTPGADQDAFLGTSAGTISKIYDQSGNNNYLTVAKKGSYTGTASQNDNEADAKGKSIMINGKKAYAVYIVPAQGYRNNQEGYAGYPAVAPIGNGPIPTGNKPQGSYALEDGSRANVGDACCFNFGTASLNNAAGGRGQMNALFFGVCTWWDQGKGNGPWFMNDVEDGVYAGGKPNNKLPSSMFDYAFGLIKNNSTNATIRVANGTALYSAAAPSLVTALDTAPPFNWNVPGGITLGIGGDNSNSSNGTFYEGCIVAGRPSDATDTLILKNVVAARYGATTPSATLNGDINIATTSSMFNVRYNPSTANAVISYTLRDAGHVSINIFDQQGRLVATVVNGVISSGPHEAVWDAKRVTAGVYVCRTAIDGRDGWTGRIVLGK